MGDFCVMGGKEVRLAQTVTPALRYLWVGALWIEEKNSSIWS